MKNTLVIITGPSCAGKSTLESLLVKKGFHRLLSTTTRHMRKGEKQNESYRFLSHSGFEDRFKNGEFVEEVEFNGNRYGVMSQDVFSALTKGNSVVVVEPHGKQQFEKFAKLNDIRVVRIFVNNPQQVILQRFLERFGEDYILDAEKSIVTYAARLGVIQTVESTWTNDLSADQYDLVFNEFNELNVVPVLQAIMRKVSIANISEELMQTAA